MSDIVWGDGFVWGSGEWGFSPEAKALQEVIKGNKHQVFRRLYMKRRESTGEYETSWQRIPDKYIMKFGSIDYGVDDIKVNFYRYSGMKLTLDNIAGYFSEVTDARSFFYNKMTRFRTMVKAEAGYVYNGVEYPTTSTLFIGFIADDMPYKDDSLVECQLKHLSGIFEEFPAVNITGLGITQTASDMITKIRDYQDAGATFYFRKFVTLTSWNIDATTVNYNMATTASLENQSVWEFMTSLTEAENKILYISREGELYFKAKTANTSTAVWHFSGLGDTDNSYGKNILKQMSIESSIRKIYNRIRIKYGTDDTSTSYYTKQETWQWGDSSSSFMYGVREYEYANEFLLETTASLIANQIFAEYQWPKKEVKLQSKFAPHLDIGDLVTFTYKTTPTYSGGSLWGYFNWGETTFGAPAGGYNINVDNESFVVLSLKHDLDKFISEFTLRES